MRLSGVSILTFFALHKASIVTLATEKELTSLSESVMPKDYCCPVSYVVKSTNIDIEFSQVQITGDKKSLLIKNQALVLGEEQKKICKACLEATIKCLTYFREIDTFDFVLRQVDEQKLVANGLESMKHAFDANTYLLVGAKEPHLTLCLNPSEKKYPALVKHNPIKKDVNLAYIGDRNESDEEKENSAVAHGDAVEVREETEIAEEIVNDITIMQNPDSSFYTTLSLLKSYTVPEVIELKQIIVSNAGDVKINFSELLKDETFPEIMKILKNKYSALPTGLTTVTPTKDPKKSSYSWLWMGLLILVPVLIVVILIARRMKS